MAKRKETFFERLTRKNAEQAEMGKAPKKRKSWKILVLGSVLTVAAVAGITIPLVINSTKVNYLQPQNGNTVVYSFKSPISEDTKISYTINLIEERNKENNDSNYNSQLNNLTKLATYYLYEQEAKASSEYQRLWNASRKSGEKETTSLRLKTISELETEFRNEIKDLKENTIKKFGYENWESQFNQLLIDNYSGAKTIEEAVSNKVYDSIKSDALRRFKLNTSDVKDLLDRVANVDIFELDENGKPNSEKLLVAKGEKVFTWLKPITSENPDGNYIEYNGKYMGLMTESFVTSQKSAKSFIEYYLTNENPYLFTQFTLPGVAKEKNDGKWNLSKENFKYLMYLWPINSNETPSNSYDMVKNNFKPFSSYIQLLNEESNSNLPTQARVYNDVINKLSVDSDTLKANFGTQGILSLKDLFKDNQTMLKAFATMPEVLFGTTQIQEIDLFAKLKEIQDSIITDQSIAQPDFTNADTLEKKQKIITDFNEAIKKAFDEADESKEKGLYDSKFQKLVTNKIAELFEIGQEVNGNKQLQGIYKLKGSETTYILLDTTGISLIDINNLANVTGDTAEIKLKNQVNKMIEMIKNDFILSNKFKQLTGVKYNALNVLNKSLTDSSFVLATMLNDQDFTSYLLEQNNPFATDEQNNLIKDAKFTTQVIEDLKSQNNQIIFVNKSQDALNVLKNVETWMKTRADNGADQLFTLKNNIVYFKNNSDENANTIMSKVLKTRLDLWKGGNNEN
ncbi:HinT-interacting membrane complex protein P80 [Mycoplasmopsis gallinarum]|uniref:Membrane protein P80 n=1 Tax=Mycoplasmopsis gallinarum TaxID=29557 RepID=A0A168RFP1_9BACT|nr:hypothetical protein [Mycoplasmopsis gallinarum]OAB48936.1 hypothetical protein MGALLINA_02650 [Mycoplasmopsis gallinarum]